jgi:2-phospho-L-lactate guanylyltransferase (CobY/MobA/RfbA family)
VQVAWVDPALLQAHRAIPRLLRRELKGVGDEAYRAVMGGGVVVRQGGRVLMVMGRLPDMSDDGRDRALEAVARVTLASSTGTGTGTGT